MLPTTRYTEKKFGVEPKVATVLESTTSPYRHRGAVRGDRTGG
jgi:hypothetical protein